MLQVLYRHCRNVTVYAFMLIICMCVIGSIMFVCMYECMLVCLFDFFSVIVSFSSALGRNKGIINDCHERRSAKELIEKSFSIASVDSADGKFEVSFKSNVVLYSDGTIMWIPCAIYKSSCTIDVKYFPFDEQTCEMIYGSWTYNGNEVDLTPYTTNFTKVSNVLQTFLLRYIESCIMKCSFC